MKQALLIILLFFFTCVSADTITGEDYLKMCDPSELQKIKPIECHSYTLGVLEGFLLMETIANIKGITRTTNILTETKSNLSSDTKTIIAISKKGALSEELYQQHLGINLDFCYKKQKIGQLIRVAYKYIKENPEKEHQPISLLLLNSWKKAFPVTECTSHLTESDIDKLYKKSFERADNMLKK